MKKLASWLLRSKWLWGIVALVLLALVAKGAFELWRFLSVPAHAPHIVMSLDDTWLNDLGITRSTYDQAMARVGGKLVTVEPGSKATQDISLLLSKSDGLLLTGGGDVDPELYGGSVEAATSVKRVRDDLEIALIREARRRKLPILGICRGCQILNVAHGGTLRNLRSQEELAETHFGVGGHAVQLQPKSRVAKVFQADRLENVMSFHGQAVAKLGDGVRATAHADDRVIEAIEIGQGDDEWIVAVQWHPELAIQDSRQLQLFRAFLAEARQARLRRLERARR